MQPEGTWKWADVEETKTHLQIICLSNRHEAEAYYEEHLAGDRTPPPTTLRERLDQLPSALRRLCGEVSLPEDGGTQLAATALREGLLGVSDGSVKGL